METSTIQAIKLAIVSVSGLSKDALHIYVGLTVLILAAGVLRKRLSSIVPWGVVLVIAITGETLDMRDDILSSGYWRWGASLHDVVNTLFWPTMLTVLARFAHRFQIERSFGTDVWTCASIPLNSSIYMARNIEIKARIDSVEALQPIAAALADQGPFEILQDDTFFSCDSGRMKLRAFSDTKGELIFYRRPDRTGPKESFYVISPTTAPDSLREALSLGYGQVGRVRKHRTLYLAGRTRIHLDRVEGLGDFLELEVVLSDDELPESGVAVANELLGRLGISPAQMVEGAYVDLLKQATA